MDSVESELAGIMAATEQQDEAKALEVTKAIAKRVGCYHNTLVDATGLDSEHVLTLTKDYSAYLFSPYAAVASLVA